MTSRCLLRQSAESRTPYRARVLRWLGVTLLAVALPSPGRAAECEGFEAGFPLGGELRLHPDWFYEAGHTGPVPLPGTGTGGTVGLSAGASGFAWVARPFRFQDPSFESCRIQMDFQTNSNGRLNDDRVGWTISRTDDSSTWHFGVQAEPNGFGGVIQCYWDGSSFGDDGGRLGIVNHPKLAANAWYRLRADFTKLTPTSCRIDVYLLALDASGHETGWVVAGAVPDTDALPGTPGAEVPNAGYFTAAKMWPVFKNYSATTGACDNPCFFGPTAEGNEPPDDPSLVSPADGGTTPGTAPDLRVTVSDPDGDPCTVTFHGRELPDTSGDSFTVIPLPDTQKYSWNYPEIYDAQMQWVVDERADRNIVFVAHEGDIVEHEDEVEEWVNADASMSLLEDPIGTGLPEGIAYSMVPGNHDMPTSLYNQYFGISRFSGRSYYGGHYGNDNDNNFTLFSGGGLDFLVVSLEKDPSSGAIAWADSVIQAHPDRHAIFVSHHLLEMNGHWGGPGQTIYNTLKDNPNLFLMLCGHRPGEAFRTDTYLGSTVHSLLADYQDRPSGGDGWLRILTFEPANDRIRVTTYSPTLDEYGADPVMGENTTSQEFFVPFEMSASKSTPFTALGTVVGVTPGSDAAVLWSGLAPETTYEWYVEVTDGTETTTGPTWSFTTGDATTVGGIDAAPGPRLLGNHPNPGRPGTRIHLELPRGGRLLVRVYDVRGAHVATLADGLQVPGYREIAWDGRDELGRPVPAGLYFYCVVSGGVTASGKLTLIR